MKQINIFLLTLLLGLQQINAQESEKPGLIRTKVMAEYSSYFTQVEVTDNGKLSLSAADKYTSLPSEGKEKIMAGILKAWQDSLVIVYYGSKKELWGWNSESGKARLVDNWDLNAPLPANALFPKAQRPVYHPWFVYLGGQLGADNQKNINISLNTRVGFFLLLNRWDFATTLSAGRSGTVDSETSSGWADLGLMSTVHFPIRKLGISPNIGGEVSVASFGGAETTNMSLLLGVSWFVGFGSLDIGVKIGKDVSTMGGLTFCPRARTKK